MVDNREVTQYDFSFNAVATYKNTYHVLNSINITRIYDILKLSNRKAYGYFWSFSDIDVMHEKRVVIAIFENDASDNKYVFYDSISEAAIDTCTNEADVFSSMMTGIPVNGTLFTEYCDDTHKILELNKDYNVVAIHDKLSDAVKSSGISANNICYILRKNESLTPKYIKGKTYIKLKSYVNLFTNRYE